MFVCDDGSNVMLNDVRWVVPPGPVHSTSVAHAHIPPRAISLCEKYKDLDKGFVASDADLQCPRCVNALRKELLERMGAKRPQVRDDDWGIDDMLRTGALQAKMVRVTAKAKCDWGHDHYVKIGEIAVLIEMPDEDERGYACLKCWDRTRIGVLK